MLINSPDLVFSTVNFIVDTGYVFSRNNFLAALCGYLFVCECCDCLYTWDVACSLSVSSLTPQKNVIMFFWPAEHLQEVNPLKHREISGLKPQHFSDSFRCVCMHMKQYWEAALKWTKPQSSYPSENIVALQATYTTVQKCVRLFCFFLMARSLHLCNQEYSKNCIILLYYSNLK